MIARYDGQTDWYESFASHESFSAARAAAVRLLGPGDGRCLDLGCGTGHAIPILVEAGWSVVGTDLSADQLAVARRHAGYVAEQLIRAEARALPFRDDEFDAVVSILTHGSRRRRCRVRRGPPRPTRRCTFVHLGIHPCFGFVQREDGAPLVLRPAYRNASWRRDATDPTSSKISARVGINHLPPADLINAIVRSGFMVTDAEEPGDADPPLFLAFRATKPS